MKNKYLTNKSIETKSLKKRSLRNTVFLFIGVMLLFVISACQSVQTSSLNQESQQTVLQTRLASAVNGTVLETVLFSANDFITLGLSSTLLNCTSEEYETGLNSPLAQYSMCQFSTHTTATSEIVIELQKFADEESRNGAYEYASLHLRGIQGLISENTHADLSRFYGNNESETYYYHFWICKDTYLIHVTSKGVEADKKSVQAISELILSRLE